MAKKKLLGLRVEDVECRFKRPLEEMLVEFESFKTPISEIAKRLRVPKESVKHWRRKMKFKKRK